MGYTEPGRKTLYLGPSVPVTRPVRLGSKVDGPFDQLYKLHHVSHDGQYIFETVVMPEADWTLCLYTKIISAHGVVIGVSVNAVRQLRDNAGPLLPIENLLSSKSNMFFEEGFYFDRPSAMDSYIVPPVFGEESLFQHVMMVQDHIGSFTQAQSVSLGNIYKPILEHVPTVYKALQEGEFLSRSPFYEIGSRHPYIDFVPEKWFLYQEAAHHAKAGTAVFHANYDNFDTVALAMMTMSVSSFRVTTSLSAALNGNALVMVSEAMHDPYFGVLHGVPGQQRVQQLQSQLSHVFYQAFQAYCHISRHPFELYTQDHESTITLIKTVGEEVGVLIHDQMTDNHVMFYTSFPALAMATLMVGGS
jgi:hypothetical protein